MNASPPSANWRRRILKVLNTRKIELKNTVDQKISIGPYVLIGGEIPALTVIDSIIRLIPGVLVNSQSLENETFVESKTDFPQYTRPDEFQGESVPEVLKSDHR